jgi:hypothetical protein
LIALKQKGRPRRSDHRISRHHFLPISFSGIALGWIGQGSMSTRVQVFGRLHDDPIGGADGRRPKSAKARNRELWSRSVLRALWRFDESGAVMEMLRGPRLGRAGGAGSAREVAARLQCA